MFTYFDGILKTEMYKFKYYSPIITLNICSIKYHSDKHTECEKKFAKNKKTIFILV